MLEIACRRCERRGRLSVDRLLEQHGDPELPDLCLILPGDCQGRCGVERRAALRLLLATPPAWARRRAADPQQQVDGPEAGERDHAGTVALALPCNN
jgi:hypothetical protein